MLQVNTEILPTDSVEYVTLDGDIEAIRIKHGEYNGVIYKYDNIQLNYDEPNDELILHFEFEVLQNPAMITIDKEFETYIGDILVYLLSN